jgi:hypothetical protein
MSPFNTLTNWSNSSIEADLTTLPTLVKRNSSGSGLPFSSKASLIVLNLIILNGSEFKPGRF